MSDSIQEFDAWISAMKKVGVSEDTHYHPLLQIARKLRDELDKAHSESKKWDTAFKQALNNTSDRVEQLEAALEKIERWFGEFPETGEFYDKEKQHPISYAGNYGSNGERDFMRNIAKEALKCANGEE